VIRVGRAAYGLSRRDRRQLRANLARSQKSGLLIKRKLPAKHPRRPPTRWKFRRLWAIALARPRLIRKNENCSLKMKPPRTPLSCRNLLTPQLRANLARSRESSGRTARSPAPQNACGVTESRRPVMKKQTPHPVVELLEPILILALPTKRRHRAVSVWRNRNFVWKKAAKS